MADDLSDTDPIETGAIKGGLSLRKAIIGGLKAAINDHGPITKEWIGSAEKRIRSSISHYNKQAKEQQRLRVDAKMARIQKLAAEGIQSAPERFKDSGGISPF